VEKDGTAQEASGIINASRSNNIPGYLRLYGDVVAACAQNAATSDSSIMFLSIVHRSYPIAGEGSRSQFSYSV